MTEMSIGPTWKITTVVIYGLAAAVGITVTVGSFDRGLDISLVVWTFGMIAAVFACLLAVLAAAAFLRRDDDRSDMHSFLGTVLFLVSAPATTGGGGILAAGLTLAAWMTSRVIRSRHRRAWRDDFVERREFLSGLRRRDPREVEGGAFIAAPAIDKDSPPPEPIPQTDGEYAATRSELKKRAREMDQDPWGQPPP